MVHIVTYMVYIYRDIYCSYRSADALVMHDDIISRGVKIYVGLKTKQNI